MQKSLSFVGLLLIGCGGTQTDHVVTPYTCTTSIGPIGAYTNVNCDIVRTNVDKMTALMSGLEGFANVASHLEDLTVEDTDHWALSNGTLINGITWETGPTVHMEVNNSMATLAHEMGHAWRFVLTGDGDPNHLTWHETGQDVRDAQYASEAAMP